jgi:hypothetical protein
MAWPGAGEEKWGLLKEMADCTAPKLHERGGNPSLTALAFSDSMEIITGAFRSAVRTQPLTRRINMATVSVATTSFSAKADKKAWTVPVIQILDIRSAEGNSAGPHNDKFGSLSKT